MTGAYVTYCVECREPVTTCVCEGGPSLPPEDKTPGQPVDTGTPKQCVVCGNDPNTELYRKALCAIAFGASPPDKKSARFRRIAADALAAADSSSSV